MAKATITFEDSPTGLTVRIAFVPPLNKGEALTDAQSLAMTVVNELHNHPDRQSTTVTGK